MERARGSPKPKSGPTRGKGLGKVSKGSSYWTIVAEVSDSDSVLGKSYEGVDNELSWVEASEDDEVLFWRTISVFGAAMLMQAKLYSVAVSQLLTLLMDTTFLCSSHQSVKVG